MTTIYHEPARFGLKLITSHDAEDAYSFDIVAVWQNLVTGRYYVGHDAGCSCPAPFEDTDASDLTEVRTLADVAEFARDGWEGLDGYGYGENIEYTRGRERAVAALLDGLTIYPGVVGGDAA